MNAAAHFVIRHAAPAAATGTLLALSLSPAAAEAKVDAGKTDLQAVKKSIADLIGEEIHAVLILCLSAFISLWFGMFITWKVGCRWLHIRFRMKHGPEEKSWMKNIKFSFFHRILINYVFSVWNHFSPEDDMDRRGDGTSLTGTFVRLAWHCAGTFSKVDGSGGSNGARMRFSPEATWGANAGLDLARKALESVKEKHPEISYADLYTLAGVVAVEEANGPKIPFRLGRTDADSGESSPEECGLPDADKGSFKNTCQHVRDVFYRMGFSDREIVALLGAHALGRCHTDRSGYWGPWTFAENTFSNEYFRLLIEERWSPKMTHNGQPWTG